MTQELVAWVLVAGFIGWVWVFTCAVLTEDRAATEQATDEQEPEREPSEPAHRRAAA
jgi:hypothetical protein